jgi:hypothetical protein
MQATDRLLEIEEKFGSAVQSVVPIEFDGETLRLIIYLKDDTNLRVTEQWELGQLKRYSYYWLTSDNQLKIGWDNAPHHKKLDTFPHHKHFKHQDNIHFSLETCLEQVMSIILNNV